MKRFLITVFGPTAIGKTTLSIQLARYFNTEILSCDSRQCYREMAVGTAVPTQEEQAAVPHHFIQDRSVSDDFNVGQFEREALSKLDKLFPQHPVLIMVGGSGLYANAVLDGLDHFPEVAPGIRDSLTEAIQAGKIKDLQRQLKQLDPESYHSIDLDNPQRLTRALEICISSGKPYASFKQQAKAARNFSPVKIGLSAPREQLYQRINDRVDQMIAQGLLEEARQLYPLRHVNALQTVGYRELFRHFDGDYSLERAVEEIKKNTRRFAKRQLTWNRKDSDIVWFDFQTDAQEIFEYINSQLSTEK